MRAPTSGVLIALGTLLSVGAGMKWHDGAVAAPDRLEVGGGPALLLVLRGDDCPDRRGGLERWLSSVGAPSLLGNPGPSGERFHGKGAPEEGLLGLEFLVVHLSPPARPLAPGTGEGSLTRFRPVEADIGGQASRALRRAGVPGTPAFLLLDGDGRVLLGEEVTENGPGQRLALAGSVIQGLLPPPGTDDIHPEGGDAGCPEVSGAEGGSCAEAESWSS